MPPRVILFDLFDTLVDLFMERLEPSSAGRHATYRALHEVIVRRIDLDFESFSRELGEVDRAGFRRWQEQGREWPTRERFGDLLRRLDVPDPELALELTEVHMGKLESMTGFVEHHPEVLRELGAVARLGICSNFTHAPMARRILERAELAPHLDEIVISEEVGFRKPRPEIFRAALRRMGVAPADAIHVGDDLRADVEGAGALGIRTVWITRRVRDPRSALQDHAGRRPDWVIEDLGELPDLISSA